MNLLRQRAMVGGQCCPLIVLMTTGLLLVFYASLTSASAQAGWPDADFTKSAQMSDEITGNPRDPDQWRLLRQGGGGQTAVPDEKAGTLIESSGQAWRVFRDRLLPRYGAWALSGVCAVLAVFFALRGRIRIQAGFSGVFILRFGPIERFAHWLLAMSFIVLAVTGLNILYGRDVLKPLLGYAAFAEVTAHGKWLHDYAGYAFIVGLVLVAALWARDNIPNRDDVTWLLRGGGLISLETHPPARKFNAGQKIIFWFVVLAGALTSFTGICLLFPFTFTPFGETFTVLNFLGFDLPVDLSSQQEMQLTHASHAVLGLIMIVVVIAHIYLGSIGMEGAYEAMATGYVDENWAREHHSLWAAELGHGSASDGANATDSSNVSRHD